MYTPHSDKHRAFVFSLKIVVPWGLTVVSALSLSEHPVLLARLQG